MSTSLRAKIGLILLFIAVFFSFALILKKSNESEALKNSTFSAQNFDNPNYENLNKTSVSDAPTQFDERQGSAKGENLSVKFEKDLETSLGIQQIPKIWLEFIDEKNQLIKVEIPEKAQEFVAKRWLRTLLYSYQNQLAEDRETQIDIQENYINDAAVLATKIDDFEIQTPAGKRKISQEEAFAIVAVTAKLAIERYEELQKMASQIKPQKIGD